MGGNTDGLFDRFIHFGLSHEYGFLLLCMSYSTLCALYSDSFIHSSSVTAKS